MLSNKIADELKYSIDVMSNIFCVHNCSEVLDEYRYHDHVYALTLTSGVFSFGPNEYEIYLSCKDGDKLVIAIFVSTKAGPCTIILECFYCVASDEYELVYSFTNGDGDSPDFAIPVSRIDSEEDALAFYLLQDAPLPSNMHHLTNTLISCFEQIPDKETRIENYVRIMNYRD